MGVDVPWCLKCKPSAIVWGFMPPLPPPPSLSLISPPGNTTVVTRNFPFLRFLVCCMRGARRITCQSLDPIVQKIDMLQSKCFCSNSAGSRYRGNRTAASSVTSNVSMICQINWKHKCRMSTYGVCIEGNECFGFSQQR